MQKRFYLVLILVLSIGISVGLSLNVSAQSTAIPSWIKNTAKHWANGDVSDAEFINAMQWLINQRILTMPTTSSSTSSLQTSANTSTIHNQAESVYASRMAQYSTSASSLNTDLIYPPISVGQLWTAYKPITSPIFLNSKSSVEEIFVNNVVNPATVVTIDVAEFNTAGEATSAYLKQPIPSGDNIQTFDVKHSGGMICFNYEKTSGSNISITINCHIGPVAYHIGAVGGLSTEEDVLQFTGIIS